jgi:hypothetical protein
VFSKRRALSELEPLPGVRINRIRSPHARSLSKRTPKQTLLLILLPMLGTVLRLRLYLHLVRVQHVYPGGGNLGSNKWSKLPIGACGLVDAGFICRENCLRGSGSS